MVVQPLERRIALVDRPGLAISTAVVFGPLETPGADALRRALRRLAADQPRHRLFARLDRGRARWLHPGATELEQRCAELVVEDELDVARPERTMERLLALDCGDQPIRLLVGPDGAGAVFTHAFGDGAYINELLPELLRAAREDRAPRLPVEGAQPLFRAVARFYLRRPRRIARLLAAPRGALPADEPAALPPRWGVLHARSAPGFFTHLRHQRIADGRRVSSAATVFADARRAADRRLGLPCAGLTIVADCRRYARRRNVPGNFSTGLRLAVSDARSPEAVAEAIKEAIAAGRPLATLALAALGSARRGTGAVTVCRPDLSLSYLGHLRAYRDLPWLDGARATYAGIGTPHNPGEVNLTLAELGDALQVTAVFDRGRYAVADVAALLADLVRGLEEAPEGRSSEVLGTLDQGLLSHTNEGLGAGTGRDMNQGHVNRTRSLPSPPFGGSRPHRAG
jgi:hypothetical protein